MLGKGKWGAARVENDILPVSLSVWGWVEKNVCDVGLGEEIVLRKPIDSGLEGDVSGEVFYEGEEGGGVDDSYMWGRGGDGLRGEKVSDQQGGGRKVDGIKESFKREGEGGVGRGRHANFRNDRGAGGGV